MSDDAVKQQRDEFYQEARELFDGIFADILEIEADPDNTDALNSLFRGIHTIKGSAGTFGMDCVSEFAHHLEGVLNALRSGEIDMSPDLVDVILAGADHMEKMVRQVMDGLEPEIDQELVGCFTVFKKVPDADPEETDGTCPADRFGTISAESIQAPGDVLDEVAAAMKDGDNGFQIRVRYTSDHLEHGYDPLPFLKALKSSCSVYHAVYPQPVGGKTSSESPVPAMDDDFRPTALYLCPTLIVTTPLSAGDILDLTFDPDLIGIDCIEVSDAAENGLPAYERGIEDEQIIAEFVAGASEMLESAEHAVIEYESNGSPAALNDIFRTVHNIKGDADFVGFEKLTKFTHALESMLSRLRSGELKRTNHLVDVVLTSLDYIANSIRELERGEEAGEFPRVFKTLKQYAEPRKQTHVTIIKKDLPPDTDGDMTEVFSEQLSQYRAIIMANMEPVPLVPEKEMIVSRALRSLQTSSMVVGIDKLSHLAGDALSVLAGPDLPRIRQTLAGLVAYIDELIGISGKHHHPIMNPMEPNGQPVGRKRIGEILVENGKVSEEDISNALAKQSVMGLEWEDQECEMPADGEAGALSSPETPDREIRTMRVNESKVEDFTNLTGELMVARNTYEYLLERAMNGDGNGFDRETLKALKDNLHLISRLTNDIHHGVMSLRMVPVGGIFKRLVRIVRDIRRKQKKSIELILDGEEIDIDKKAADMLFDPLVHLVRNACDHGIESSEERAAAGKPDTGTVVLKAERQASSIQISIMDDGRGIDRQGLMEKAIMSGVALDSDEDSALLDLIFVPGLSTRSKATDLSGRGVGMDVVRTTVHALGGSLRVRSDEGAGTHVFLDIPMTMGIETVLLVDSGPRTYALPLPHILETLKIPLKKVKHRGRQMLFYYRNEVIAAERLDDLLQGKPGEETAHGRAEFDNDTELSIIITRGPWGKFGIVVDGLKKNMEIAVKPVPPMLAGMNYVSGVSIMGDGKVILVLNPEMLVNE